jgi:hypothetical protein
MKRHKNEQGHRAVRWAARQPQREVSAAEYAAIREQQEAARRAEIARIEAQRANRFETYVKRGDAIDDLYD